MEIGEIKAIVKGEILDKIKESGKGLIYRDYITFLSWFDMYNRRNPKRLIQLDRQFKNYNITLWCRNEPRKSVADFSRGETITFRQENAKDEDGDFALLGKKEVASKNAGTVQIVNEESGITLYKHQEEAIESMNRKITRANNSPFGGLVVLPTGGGKTLTAAYWLSRNILDKNKKILWIAHRHELLEQAKITFHKKLAYKDIFESKQSFNYRIVSGIHDKPVHIRPTDDLIISSKDSLNAGFEYLYNNWIKDKTDEIFLVIDEAHHATAKTYRKLISNLQEKVRHFRMIGLTATPFRTAEAEQGLLAKVFPDDIIYKVDLRTLINRGILSEPVFEEVETGFDMTSQLTKEELDNLKYFDIESIGTATAKTIAENVFRNSLVVTRYVKNKKKYRQTIVFALNKDNAIALRKLFQEASVKADFVLSSIKDMMTGATLSNKENKQIIDRFRNGELDVLINVNILTEGTDLPKVQSVFLARPTISPILMTQMIGRGLRGEQAGGTKEAYIVSFIDDWKDKVAWVNPEKLFIEENVDFNDKDRETRKQLIRLVAINKIEEFAILTKRHIDSAKKEALETLDFIERLPLGIYHFSLIGQIKEEDALGNVEEEEAKQHIKIGEAKEKNCEVLVYSNIRQSYDDFVNALPGFFRKHKLTQKDYLTEDELEILCTKVEDEFFFGCEKYPGYSRQDIKDILQFYAQDEASPDYIELKDRSKYDLTKVAHDILDRNMRSKEEEVYKKQLWESNQVEWKAFFGYDERYFLNEIDLAIRKLANPDLYKRTSVVPKEISERRKLESLTMGEIRDYNPRYWKWLSDEVYKKHQDEEGFYVSAKSGYKSKNKLDFQIDHIKPFSKGGLTTFDNLQLLTRQEHAAKGVS